MDVGVFSSANQRELFTSGILSWLESNVSHFEPPKEDEVFERPELIVPGKRRKAFGELGLALCLSNRLPELRSRPEIQYLTRTWLTLVETQAIFFDLRRRVHLVPLMTVALGVLAELGSAPCEIRESLQIVLDRAFLDRTELGSYPKLDLKYYFDKLDLCHEFADDAVLLAGSTLIRSPSIPYAHIMDFYAITHLVFAFSDFGRKEIATLLGDDFFPLREYVDLAMVTALAAADYDLTAELLMSRLFLGATPNNLDRCIVDALCAAQQPSGFIPDRAWLADTESTEEDTFFKVYHPTLVCLILLACRSTPHCAPRSVSA